MYVTAAPCDYRAREIATEVEHAILFERAQLAAFEPGEPIDETVCTSELFGFDEMTPSQMDEYERWVEKNFHDDEPEWQDLVCWKAVKPTVPAAVRAGHVLASMESR